MSALTQANQNRVSALKFLNVFIVARADLNHFQQKAALEKLKFSKKENTVDKDQQPTTLHSASSSSSSVVSISSISSASSTWGLPPPAQSRDGSSGMNSRFFTPAPTNGNVLVPNSSPNHIPGSSSPTNSHGRGQGRTNGYYRPPPQARLPLAADPIAGPSNFSHSHSAPYDLYSPPQPRNQFASSVSSPNLPRFPPAFASPPPSSLISPSATPDSPAVRRLGQRIPPARPSGSDDTLPVPPPKAEVKARVAQPSTVSPASSAASASGEDKEFNRFRFTFVEFEMAKVSAAWKQSGRDPKKAEQLLKDPNWVWKVVAPLPPPKVVSPSAASGRAQEVRDEARRQREAGKERAKKSAIYAARNDLEKRGESSTPPRGAASAVVPESPASPEIVRRKGKRGRLAVETDDEEDEANTPASDAEPSRIRRRVVSDDDVEILPAARAPSTPPRPSKRAVKSDSQAALEYLNTQGVDALRELTGSIYSAFTFRHL